MTTEEKELLIKDICARLPYGVQLNIDGFRNGTLQGIEGDRISTEYGINYPLKLCKPYLKPMSSMTNREKAEYTSLRSKGGYDWDEYEADKLITWLDKNMFDHRGLIKKDLALPLSPEE